MNVPVPFNRHVGLLVLEVTMSNPNGDPDMESEPRTRELDGRGMISPVSLKRKYRDLVDEVHLTFEKAKNKLQLGESKNEFQILESRGRKRQEILKLKRDDFIKKYWDARMFGNTFLESLKEPKKKSNGTPENENLGEPNRSNAEELKELQKRKKDGELQHLINTGVVQIGVGLSVMPIDVIRMTNTSKSGVEEDKDRGMAPLAFKVVQHGIYCIPFYVNPCVAVKTGATEEDLNLFKFLTPYVYQHTASAIRPQISILHAWCAEHKNALGSCPEYLLIEALTPKVKDEFKMENIDISNKPVLTRDCYDIPTKDNIEQSIRDRFIDIYDLNEKTWG